MKTCVENDKTPFVCRTACLTYLKANNSYSTDECVHIILYQLQRASVDTCPAYHDTQHAFVVVELEKHIPIFAQSMLRRVWWVCPYRTASPARLSRTFFCSADLASAVPMWQRPHMEGRSLAWVAGARVAS